MVASKSFGKNFLLCKDKSYINFAIAVSCLKKNPFNAVYFIEILAILQIHYKCGLFPWPIEILNTYCMNIIVSHIACRQRPSISIEDANRRCG